MNANDLVQDIQGLITLPDVYLRINQLIEDPDSSVADIAKVVSQDPSFTIRLLRVANSPLYNFSSKVDSVSRAVTIIGTAQIRNLALSMSVASSFDGMPNELISMSNFWRHSLLCALVSRHLAAEARRDRDVLFTAGLLHDIGELVIFNRLPAEAQEALLLVLDSQEEVTVPQAERQILGFDHADVGGALAQQWHLPPVLAECIAHHHDIAAAKRHPREVALVHIGNLLAQMAEIDTLDTGDVAPIDPRAWEVTGLDESCIEPAIQAAREEIVEVEQLFMGRT
jgi:putative nucleotidyltransferase with HDIG domain